MTARKPKSEHKKPGPKGPTKYSQEMVEKLEAFGLSGEGVLEACLELGISKQTFYEWGRKYPEFSDAIKQFKLHSQVWWEKAGRDGAVGKIPSFNATSYIFNMKNRFPEDWGENQKIELTGKDGGPIKTEDVTRDSHDFTRRLSSLAARAGSTGAPSDTDG